MNMKRTIPLFAAFFLFAFLWTQSPAQAADPIFINEIHYDNLDADTNEGVEIAGPAGTDLSGWKIFLYNGASTQLKVYDTINLSGTISDQCNGYGTLHFTRAGIQNGAPDGLALVNAANQGCSVLADTNIIEYPI